eukprot:4675785-Alexandrium_andersonii.AAC.1
MRTRSPLSLRWAPELPSDMAAGVRLTLQRKGARRRCLSGGAGGAFAPPERGRHQLLETDLNCSRRIAGL